MMIRKLKINHTDFETAFELSSNETTAYLNTETGVVSAKSGEWWTGSNQKALNQNLSKSCDGRYQANNDRKSV